MSKFNIIKKSRKKSEGIDEKIEYLDKECQKTGLREGMVTSKIYQGSTKVPNQHVSDFVAALEGGYPLVLSDADGDQFTFALSDDPGAFTNNTSNRTTSLPHFRPKKTPGTYYIYRSEEV